ncbi:hypothetical protein N7462_008901 [Penicillium macrosclerotiorum]|uniref:uncharacterized protein n=1 Tax=Penicillium macrosclerotiorum TaxID=303699 RepID=UPI0025469B00|nr:uncharacterized protein N7462_008901 [Penicillium macrosclerotiorum]KAJ5676004.1 hypothetical protein N7462_008901 [Penicillium macrosclerotiorum]
MPPKLSKGEKQDLILAHLQATGTCHTLKDLEKALPAVASIHSIQVKEYIQTLTDENRLRVEKIGSGNWYWSFGTDERHTREQQLARVKTEVEKARIAHTEAAAALAAATAQHQEESDQIGECELEAALGRKTELATEVDGLRARATSAHDSLSHKGVQQLQKELAGFRQQAQQWTDNLYVLEGFLRQLAGGDREIVTAVLRECYGAEYVDGEGLRELDEGMDP